MRPRDEVLYRFACRRWPASALPDPLFAIAPTAINLSAVVHADTDVRETVEYIEKVWLRSCVEKTERLHS